MLLKRILKLLIINLFYYSTIKLIESRPFLIADEVSNNNFITPFNNLNDEKEQYIEAMKIARDTFFQLKPLTTRNNNEEDEEVDDQEDEDVQEENNKNKKLKFLTSLNNKRNKKKKQQHQHFNKNNNNSFKTIKNDELFNEQDDADLNNNYESQQPLHISSDIVNSTIQSNTCQGDLFKHKIKVFGCKSKSITNRFCHGSCSSFYIPRLRSKKLKATFQSCSACIPTEMDTIKIRLECPNLEKGFIYRKIVRIKKCECRNIMLDEDIGNNNNENNIEEIGDEENLLLNYDGE